MKLSIAIPEVVKQKKVLEKWHLLIQNSYNSINVRG